MVWFLEQLTSWQAGNKDSKSLPWLTLSFFYLYSSASQSMTWCCIHSAWVLPILVNVLRKCHRWALSFEVLLSPIRLSMKIKHHSYSIPPQSPKGSQASHNANSSSPFPRLSVILIIPTLFQYASSKPALIPRTNSYFNKGKMGP